MRFDLALVGFEGCGFIRLICRRLVTFAPLVLAKVTKAAAPQHTARRFAPGSLAAVSYGASRPPARYASLHLATSATPKGATRLPLQTPPLGLLMGRKLQAVPGLALVFSEVGVEFSGHSRVNRSAEPPLPQGHRSS